LVGDYGHPELGNLSEHVVTIEDIVQRFQLDLTNTPQHNSARKYWVEFSQREVSDQSRQKVNGKTMNRGRTPPGKQDYRRKVLLLLPFLLPTAVHDATGHFCAALDRDYEINPATFQGSSSKFQIQGHHNWDDAAWAQINHIYLLDKSDAKLRQGQRTGIVDPPPRFESKEESSDYFSWGHVASPSCVPPLISRAICKSKHTHRTV